MEFEEYRTYDATGLAELVAAKQVTGEELLEVARARAAAVNPLLNAIVRDVPCAPSDATSGPFAGVPFLIKDLGQDYAGLPTSSGSRALQNTPVAEHATTVQRWLDAGLLIFGKTNTPEFGAKAITEPDAWGPAHNPWDLDRTPGGSSGGSAAAVAAGIVPAAGANDGGGSIRIPAGSCGLVGLKPGRGLTPSGPAEGEAMHGAAVQGVVSRTVRDTAAMLDILRGGPGHDWLAGHGGVDALYGQDGEDLLEGGTRDDTLSGGKGRDSIHEDTAPAAVRKAWKNAHAFSPRERAHVRPCARVDPLTCAR